MLVLVCLWDHVYRAQPIAPIDTVYGVGCFLRGALVYFEGTVIYSFHRPAPARSMSRVPEALMNRCFTALAAAVLIAGCGGSDPSEPQTTPFTTIDRAPLQGAWTTESARAVSTAPEALGINEEHRLVLAAAGGVFAEVRGVLQDRPLYVGTDEAPSMGKVFSVHPKSGGGAWLAGEQGLYSVERHFVTRSPLSEALSEVHQVADVPSGALKGLWILDTAGLWLRSEGSFDKVNAHLTSPTLIAADAWGRFALMASTSDLVLLNMQDGVLQSLDIDLDTGTIYGLTGTPNAVWVAASNGLFKTDGTRWTHYPLGAKATEIAADPATGAVWVRTEGGLIQVTDNVTTRYPTGGDEIGLAVDQLGDVHSLASGALLRRGTGAADGNAVDFAMLKPWLQANCSTCHNNQTANFEDYAVFVERAEEALARVRTGDMPRCGGGIRCPPELTLSPSDFAVLEQWVRDGAPE